MRPRQVPALPRPQTQHTCSCWGHRKMRTGPCQHPAGHKAHASSWELAAHCRHYCRYTDNSEEGASLSRVALKTLLPCGWGHSCVWGAHPLETHQQSRLPAWTDKGSRAGISTFSPGDLAKQEGLGRRQPDFIQCRLHLGACHASAQDAWHSALCTPAHTSGAVQGLLFHRMRPCSRSSRHSARKGQMTRVYGRVNG